MFKFLYSNDSYIFLVLYWACTRLSLSILTDGRSIYGMLSLPAKQLIFFYGRWKGRSHCLQSSVHCGVQKTAGDNCGCRCGIWIWMAQWGSSVWMSCHEGVAVLEKELGDMVFMEQVQLCRRNCVISGGLWVFKSPSQAQCHSLLSLMLPVCRIPSYFSYVMSVCVLPNSLPCW